MIEITITHNDPQSDDEINVVDIKQGLVDNSISLLKVGNSLDYFENRLENMKILLSKLRFDGIIEISGLDIFALARNIYAAKLTLPTINDILYNGKQSTSSLIGTIDICKEAGLKILIKQLNDDDCTYYVKAKRCFPK